MKKRTCVFALSTMLLGIVSPTIQVIAETNSVIPKETFTMNSSESIGTSLSQSSVPQITPNSTTSTTTSNEEQELQKSQEEKPKDLTTTTQKQSGVTTVDNSEDIASGMFGTSHWRLDSNGVLYIGSGKFSDTPLNRDGNTSRSPWTQWRSQITSIHFEGPVVASDSLNNLFDYLSNVTNIEGIEQLDTSKTTKMQRVFGGCSSLTSLDLTAWDVSHVVDIFSLFNGATNMQTLNVSNWDTSSMNGITYAFSTMSKLKNLDLSRWKVTPLNDAQGVFMGDSSLKELDLSGFDMTKLKVASYISGYEMTKFFQNTNSLKSLKLSDKFRFWINGDVNVELPEISPNNEYSGKWENISSGTSQNPKGNDIWTSKELMQNFNQDPKNDTYVWQPISKKAIDVTVKYLNADGNEIHKAQNISGNVGDAYDAATDTYKLTIDGYILDTTKLPDNTTGTLSDIAQTVTYVYTKNPVKAADVTVKYVDTDGDKILDAVIKSGNVGDSYTTEQKTINGYTFKEVQGSATGTFTAQPQTVTYVYEQAKDQSKVIVHDSDLTVGDTWNPEDNFNSATDSHGNAVSFSDITVDGSVDTSKVGTYKVTYFRNLPSFFSSKNQGEYSAVATITVNDVQPVKAGDVTAKYIDIDGNKISDTVVKSGNVGDSYTTEQKTINGYTFKEVQGSATGTFTAQPQTVTYVYTKNNGIPSPKPDDHSDTLESSKDNGKKNDSTSENKNTLPQTGDNERLSMIGTISGLFLILGTIVMIIFKRKRQD